ncbi:tetratricopeptide repeat protein 9C-like protein [Aphelenchoides avenae]|nr:tetratricopeptide repeat protein 9C-like protein [Aphelenchus avenae]
MEIRLLLPFIPHCFTAVKQLCSVDVVETDLYSDSTESLLIMDADFAKNWQSMEKGNELKAEGNKLYKEGKYKEATVQYHFASMEAKSAISSSELVEEGKRLLAQCFNNLAACLLLRPDMKKKTDFERAVNYCDKVLAFEPANEKALYRKAWAKMEAEEWKDAWKILSEKCPHNRGTERLANRCLLKMQQLGIPLREPNNRGYISHGYVDVSGSRDEYY